MLVKLLKDMVMQGIKNVSHTLNAGDLNVVILHFKACVRYFSLFLNNTYISSLV